MKISNTDITDSSYQQKFSPVRDWRSTPLSGFQLLLTLTLTLTLDRVTWHIVVHQSLTSIYISNFI